MGCILYELAAGKLLFESDRTQLPSNWKSRLNQTLSQAERQLMAGHITTMLQSDPTLRPSARSVLEDMSRYCDHGVVEKYEPVPRKVPLYHLVDSRETFAEGPVSYAIVNFTNSRILTLQSPKKIGENLSIVVELWDACGSKITRIEENIRQDAYPRPQFSQCGTLFAVPVRNPSNEKFSLVKSWNSENGKFVRQITIRDYHTVAIGLTENRLAVSESREIEVKRTGCCNNLYRADM
jgi:serine/threonine protein kinase